ncbi:putative serine/threonine-protein kinase [Phytophthora citrophthora]|uniref:Casein kinase I n=1 Tax=Phytophthora citrophthora TaxID=4793 RepID=A0AAD9GMF9_9STRA|nr:putative serine/threonine-protein kinase [Phytophthora citrophthora]
MNMMRAASSPMEPLNKNILLAGEVIAEKWKIGEKIGEGTFSQIYSAYSIESRDKVAVKVEAPSSLKPVLEWESLILKSLQDCPYVCRYYYHGKHGDSTVLVMELLGDSMSMLRMSPDSIHGVPLAKAVSVGLEMLDCIEAFHRHGYVHRDIKASNFALSAIPERNPTKKQRYYIIDFGLSRQHLGEDRKVLPARQLAEFRGTSMYASLSSHRRQELGPKDDLWSWFYLVMDFLRGELPWAADAQLKNRQTVLRLKEHYTETNPTLLVEALPGSTQLLEMMEYLQSLKYEDFPDYKKIREQLLAVGESSLASDSDSGDEESGADNKEALAVASVSAIDWDSIETDRERALHWAGKAEEHKERDGASNLLLTIAKRYKTFFDSDGLSSDERVRVQSAVYRIEKKSRARSTFLAPPPIQSFVKRRQSEQKMRSDALRKRRERDFQVRQSLEIKNEQQVAANASIPGSSDAVHGVAGGDNTAEVQNGDKSDALRPVKSESSMEVSDTEDAGKSNADEKTTVVVQSNDSGTSAPLHQQQSHEAPHPPPGPPVQWSRASYSGGQVPPPPPPPGIPPSVQQSGGYGRPPPPLPPHLAGRYPPTGGVPPPPPGFPPNGINRGPPPPPPPPRNGNPEHRYAPTADQNYDISREASYGYQQPPKSPRESHGSVPGRNYALEREERGYGAQRPLKSPRDSIAERQYESPRELREERGYSKTQRPTREDTSVSERRYDSRMEVREDRGYQRSQISPREGSKFGPDRSYKPLSDSREDRGYDYQPQKPQAPPRESRYPTEEALGRRDKERYYEVKRQRSRSRSSRRGEGRSRRRSYSRSSSRSSYSRSPSPPSHSHRRSSREYLDHRRERRKSVSIREYSRRQHSRSRSSSRSRSRSSSRSASPPAKRYRRRSPDFSHSKSSHRHSPHSSHRRSIEYPEEYATSYQKGYSKGPPPPEYVSDYPKEYVKEYSKEYVKNYTKKVPPKAYAKDYVKEYRRRSPSPDNVIPHSRERQYRHSPSPGRQRSHSRNYDQDGGSWDAPPSEKHRRSSRWDSRS